MPLPGECSSPLVRQRVLPRAVPETCEAHDDGPPASIAVKSHTSSACLESFPLLLYLRHNDNFHPRATFCICCAGIMHLFGHVTDAQADSGYTAYFPIGVFFITLGFMVFLFLQRVLSPLLTPAGAQGTSCCAAAVPLEVCTKPPYEI